MTTKMASVLNWRSRYADAPSWTAPAIPASSRCPCRREHRSAQRGGEAERHQRDDQRRRRRSVTLAPLRASVVAVGGKGEPGHRVLLYRRTGAGHAATRRATRHVRVLRDERSTRCRGPARWQPDTQRTGWDRTRRACGVYARHARSLSGPCRAGATGRVGLVGRGRARSSGRRCRPSSTGRDLRRRRPGRLSRASPTPVVTRLVAVDSGRRASARAAEAARRRPRSAPRR